jgi:hypothetical protein
MVKIIFLENRIIPTGLPFVPVETPEGNRRGKQGTEQDKPGQVYLEPVHTRKIRPKIAFF